jgi:hypothetical protein
MKYLVLLNPEPCVINSEHPINKGDEIAVPPLGDLVVVARKIFKTSIWPAEINYWKIVEDNPDIIVALCCLPPETAKMLDSPPITKTMKYASFEGTVILKDE